MKRGQDSVEQGSRHPLASKASGWLRRGRPWALLLGWGTLAVLFGAARMRAADPPALKTNEVAVYLHLQIRLLSTTVVPGPAGEVPVRQESSTLLVRGTFAGQITISEAGKREVFLYRRLRNGLSGSLQETDWSRRELDFGEGGIQRRVVESRAEWSQPGREIDPPRFDILLDLDANTWSLRNPATGIDSTANRVARGFSYTASRYGPDDNGVYHQQVSSDPTRPIVDGPRGGPPTLYQSALLYLDTIINDLEKPHPLQRSATASFSGNYEPDPYVLSGFAAQLSLDWAVLSGPGDLELRVSSPGLAEWRPTATREELGASGARLGPGAPLELTARVVHTGGVVAPVKIRKMRWTLNDTSRLPGIAMNAPYGVNDTSPDLEFDHPNATEEGQVVEVSNLTRLFHTVRVRPWDWGGWSTLRVEAELDDGRKLQGLLPGQSGDATAIRLPAREPDSKIADAWKRRSGAVGLADDSDADAIPVGGSDGDGLTLFEEYRGFYAWDATDPRTDGPPSCISTHPRGKTVFVYDRIDDPHTRVALGMFQAASKAGVFLIKPGRRLLDDSRVVNRNAGNGPTRGPQHAIGLRRANAWLPTAPTGPGGAEVGVPALELLQHNFPSLASPRLYERAIARGLLTVCHVPSPAGRDSGDRYVRFTYRRGAAGPEVSADSGERVHLIDEATGRNLEDEWLLAAEKAAGVFQQMSGAAAPTEFHRGLFVAVRGGRHSGPLANIMRGAHAQAYRLDGTDTIVVLSIPPAEVVGMSLPNTSAGDGYNAADANPRHPRYGSSANPPPRSSFNVKDGAP